MKRTLCGSYQRSPYPTMAQASVPPFTIPCCRIDMIACKQGGCDLRYAPKWGVKAPNACQKNQCEQHELLGCNKGGVSLGWRYNESGFITIHEPLQKPGLNPASDDTAIVQKPDRAYYAFATNKPPCQILHK